MEMLEYAPSLVAGLATYYLVGFTAILLLDNNNFTPHSNNKCFG